MVARRHPTAATLWALAAAPGRRLAPGLAVHLERCPRCQEDLRDLARLMEYLGSPVEDPPPGALARAFALVAPRPPRRAQVSRFRLARLIYDNTLSATRQGVRGALVARRQLWRLPNADVDVRIDPGGLGAEPMLFGQFLPRRALRRALLQGSVWLLERGHRPRWAALGPGGDFVFPAPRSRGWSLLLECAGLRARIKT